MPGGGISPKPPGNTGQKKTARPRQEGSGYDKVLLSYPETIPEGPSPVGASPHGGTPSSTVTSWSPDLRSPLVG